MASQSSTFAKATADRSRREFLGTTAAGAAGMWVPRSVKGYTAEEVRAAAENEIGISKWDLDTPALCVDLNALERNIKTMQERVVKNGIATRPHAKTHKSADIARLQMAAGSIGICTAKLSEAEALFAAGIEKICMTTSNTSVRNIKRAIELLKKNAHFIQAVDEEQNARDLSDAAKAARVTADVVIDVAVGTRSGIPAGDGALALAKLVD